MFLALTFALGAVVGSFLNVVVYRLPLGMNLIHPASRCPNCGHAIRWHDNIPILGWFFLRGPMPRLPRAVLRSLSARRISNRRDLPDVLLDRRRRARCRPPSNAALAAMFNNQPEPDPHTEQYLARLLYHLLLLCPLLAAALIDADGHRLPRRLITWPAATGILLAFGLPTVQALSLNFADHTAPIWSACGPWSIR